MFVSFLRLHAAITGASASRFHSFAGTALRNRYLRPITSACRKLATDARPIVKRRRIKVGAIWPSQRSGFPIKGYPVEERHILERSEQNAFQHRTKVNALLGSVFKGDVQHIRSDDFKPGDAMNGVAHGLCEWIDLDGRLTGLQQIPIPDQFLAMNLHPRFDETPLRAR
jgi:hypothetical protein